MLAKQHQLAATKDATPITYSETGKKKTQMPHRFSDSSGFSMPNQGHATRPSALQRKLR
ncbi:hypothetical protein RBSH_02094 [Rhodopirellula baltica SH28]|uniref:Uncharacterized protein n=1 Tax=Rhodopirellula baltica SH28 TaxID=993517 RepID=K5CF06_RHOBT|nr:hypothetical protein RBSH_02094 [Rhodopirellula baltica SH28]